MSIWASMALVDCWTPHCEGCEECVVGMPYYYEASHIMPEPGMSRAYAGIDCAYLSKFVRHNRDHWGEPEPDGIEPWLRFSVGTSDDGTVILDRPQVEALIAGLQQWVNEL